MSDAFIDPDTDFVVKFTNFSKMASVVALRKAFAHIVTPATYRYNVDDKLSKIWISSKYPRRPYRLPALVVQADAGKADLTSFLTETITENKDAAGTIVSQTRLGDFKLQISVSILADTTTDRERLTDLVTVYFRNVFVDLFSENGLAYKKVGFGGESESSLDNRLMYESKVTVDFYSEYSVVIPVSLIDTINSIDLQLEIAQAIAQGG